MEGSSVRSVGRIPEWWVIVPHDSITITALGTYYGLPLEVIDAVRPRNLAQYVAECDYAPPADEALADEDADIDDMSVEEIEAEIAVIVFAAIVAGEIQ